ncbi:hypothetical protein I7I49_15280 [Sinorhizobium meliloti]|uniref:hypothetical protein n=1 Tax=Rhizobium meliloti TaxID=382 RepID=UPI00237EEEB8|nr:hypothetical protein [Sinorhizobium meliloti]MDE3811637.1 hypothetical protein [Sinorhizobium meliloti]
MSDDQDRPKLTVVAENTRQQIDSNLLQEEIEYALRVLAANVIRVVRGAGKPDDIIYQCNDVVKAAVEYKEKVGRFVSSDAVAGALRLARERIDDYDSFHGQRQRIPTGRAALFH